MTPAAFVAAVLPPQGYGHYCVVELSSKKKTHAFVDTLDEVVAQAQVFDGQHFNTYFALATYENTESREAKNAQWLKSFYVDIDCGEGHVYSSLDEGVSALVSFIDIAGLGALPNPIINISGGGLHVYWPLTEPVPKLQWKPIAEHLKILAKKHDFDIDHTVTADAARILRMPGTTNWKLPDNPRRCLTKIDGDGPVTLHDFATAIGYVEPAASQMPVPFVIPGVRPKAADNAAGVKLLQNSAVHFEKLLNQIGAGGGCLQIKHYLEHATEEGLEPLWRGILSIAKVCDDGPKAAQFISALHPYDTARMHQKLRDIKGPYPCTKFNSENPGVCEHCPSWGKITNPLALVRETHVDASPKQVEITAAEPEAQEHVPVFVNRPPAPYGYHYGLNGGVYAEEKSKDADAAPVMKMVVPYDLFAINLMNRESLHYVHLVAVRPGGTQTITLPMRVTVTKDDLCKALAEQNIVASERNDVRLANYVRACITHASENQLPLNIPTQYGWQKEGAFVYDGRIMAPGKETITPLPGLENIVRVTKPEGTIEGWRSVVSLLTKYKMNDILAMMTVGFGAPLMRFTSFNGITIHLGSSESGTGKSLSLAMAASIWGHPTHYMVGKDTSGVAMQQRLGLLNSLPLICDEITHKNRLNFEWFPGFVFDMTDGKGKERMDGNVNRERQNNTYWSSIALVSSNTHVMDYLSSRKHSSQGEIMRLLELKMVTALNAPDDLTTAIKDILPHNYGVAGAMFARWLVDNEELARDVVRKVEEDTKRKLQKHPEERFWIGSISCMIAGAILAGRGYANIIDLPINGIFSVFASMIANARSVAASSRRSAEDVLNAYTREFYGKFVVITRKPEGVEATFGGEKEIEHNVLRAEVCGRVEHGFKPGLAEFFIEEQLLKRFCATMSFGYTDFKAYMTAKFAAYPTKKNMLSGTKGPAMNVNALKIVVPTKGDAYAPAEDPIPVV
jgi:Domain of unknown function (DUF927)